MMGGGPPHHEDLYARPRHPDQYYSASSAASTPASSVPTTPKKTFMKPSEFYAGGSPQVTSPTTVTPPKGGFQVMPAGFGKTFGKDSDYSEEYSHYDSGPLQSEQMYETRNPDGSVSLQRIFKQEQSASSSRITSSRRVFQHQEQSSK